MENLTTKINRFIRSIEFEPNGSLSITIQKEFEITLDNGQIVKQPWEAERVILEIDDSRTEEISGSFSTFFYGYWQMYKQKNNL